MRLRMRHWYIQVLQTRLVTVLVSIPAAPGIWLKAFSFTRNTSRFPKGVEVQIKKLGWRLFPLNLTRSILNLNRNPACLLEFLSAEIQRKWSRNKLSCLPLLIRVVQQLWCANHSAEGLLCSAAWAIAFVSVQLASPQWNHCVGVNSLGYHWDVLAHLSIALPLPSQCAS